MSLLNVFVCAEEKTNISQSLSCYQNTNKTAKTYLQSPLSTVQHTLPTSGSPPCPGSLGGATARARRQHTSHPLLSSGHAGPPKATRLLMSPVSVPDFQARLCQGSPESSSCCSKADQGVQGQRCPPRAASARGTARRTEPGGTHGVMGENSVLAEQRMPEMGGRCPGACTGCCH